MTERTDHGIIGPYEQFVADPWPLDDRGEGNGAARCDIGLQRGVPIARLEALEEEMDRAATRETDGERFVVAVPEGHDPMGVGLHHVERLDHDGAFDATAADRPADVLIEVDGHGCAGQSRARAVEVDHPGDGRVAPRAVPCIESVEEILHQRPI